MKRRPGSEPRAGIRRLAAFTASLDVSLLLAAAVSFAYAAATISGIPVLRHDWGADPFHSGWSEILGAGFSSWNPVGIGSPSLYPGAYLVSLAAALATALAGNRGALFLVLLATGALAAFGGRAVARDAGGRAVVACAASLFCVFNPWAYTELVAGHILMLLAYAASIWLFRELLEANPRSGVLIVTALLTLQQLQFLLVTTVLFVALGAKRRTWLPLAIVGLTWIPIAIGVLSDSSSLDMIPFVTSWERQQSIAPVDALQLNGYFAQYGENFRNFFAVPVLSTLGLAIGAFVCLPDKRRMALAAGSASALLIAMGLRGPLAIELEWLIEHVRFSALYRELFDLLAYVAIGYLILAVAACARYRILAWGWLAVMMFLPKPWLVAPPSGYWVPASALPAVAIPVTSNARFALVPAFQPMSYEGRGSGRDPDLRALPDNLTPVNEAFATYPVDAALGAFSLRGDTSLLQALSVASVVERPWLRSDFESLGEQWALPFNGFPRPGSDRTIALKAQPELALLAVPALGTLDARIGSGNIFFGDAAAARGPLVPRRWRHLGRVVRLVPPNQETKAARGWVDARLAFAQRPQLAQSLGGVLTTDSAAVLPLLGGLSALVFVEGTLRSTDGRALSRATHGYRWIALPQGVNGVTCSGLCVVAAEGDPPAAPLEPPARAASALVFRLITPWLVVAEVPSGTPAALRYNSAYDERWLAWLGGRLLTHVRLDGTVNGWLLPARAGAQRLVLLEVTSASEVAAELVVVLVLCWLAVQYARERLSASRGDRRCPRLAAMLNKAGRSTDVR